jgi:hypothetical protein
MGPLRAIALAAVLASTALPARADDPPLTVSTNLIIVKDDHVAPIATKSTFAAAVQAGGSPSTVRRDASRIA